MNTCSSCATTVPLYLLKHRIDICGKKLIHSLTFRDFPLCHQLFLHHCDPTGYNHNGLTGILDVFTFNEAVLPSGGEENKNQPGDWAKIVWFELRSMCGWI